MHDEGGATGLGQGADKITHKVITLRLVNADAVLDGDGQLHHIQHRLHAIGHQLGLDVHDLEAFGDRIHYPAGRTRSTQFGTQYLRMDMDLAAGMTFTIEPGIYWTTSRTSLSINTPVAVYRNRLRSAPETAMGRPGGDAAFADFSIMASFSHRF